MAETTVCRICMNLESNMKELFEPFSQDIISMIEFCTGVLLHKEDGLPSQMCIKCHSDLHIANTFKINCVASEKSFHQLIKCNYSTIKTEDQTEMSESAIKLEPCIDDVSNDTEITSDNTMEDSSCMNDAQSDKAVQKVPLSIRKQNKIVGRRSHVVNAKVNSRKGLKKLYCDLCKVTFGNRKEMVEHKKRFHKEEKTWICEICGKSYAHRSSQIAHKHSHYPARFACHDCDYTTYNKYDLIKHVRIHTGDKSYKCAQCAAAYRTSSNLRIHVRLVHERTRAHACHVCGKTYIDRATLNRHIDAHNDIKRYVCEVCHSCFTRRCYWKKHLQKQHDIVIPSCRPGRPKAGVLLLEGSERVT